MKSRIAEGTAIEVSTRFTFDNSLAKGRKSHDKRDYEKEKDWKREQGRLLRQHG